MGSPLRILIVEDLASDAELMTYELRQANLPFTLGEWKLTQISSGKLDSSGPT